MSFIGTSSRLVNEQSQMTVRKTTVRMNEPLPCNNLVPVVIPETNHDFSSKISSNNPLPAISHSKIRFGSNRRAIRMKRFQAKRTSVVATAALAAEEVSKATLKHSSLSSHSTASNSSSSSFSSSESFVSPESEKRRDSTRSANTNNRLLNSVVLTSDTFAILCDINAHRWIVWLLNATSLTSPSLYVPSTQHYTFGSVHDLSHRIRKHSNELGMGGTFILLKTFYLDLRHRSSKLFSANGVDPLQPTAAKSFEQSARNRKLSNILGDLSMINNMSRAPTLIAISPRKVPEVVAVKSIEAKEEFVVNVEEGAGETEEPVEEAPEESHEAPEVASWITCHLILMTLFSLILIGRYLIQLVVVLLESNIYYVHAPLVVALLNSSLFLMATIVVLVNRSQIEDLITSSASFLKPLALWQRRLVKVLPRIYFAFCLMLILTHLAAFLAAEFSEDLDHWSWSRLWTRSWQLNSFNSSSYECGQANQSGIYIQKNVTLGAKVKELRRVTPNAKLSNISLSRILNEFTASNETLRRISSQVEAEEGDKSEAVAWLLLSLTPRQSCCTGAQTTQLGSNWMYLVYLDRLVAAFIAYNLLLIKTFYFSLLLLMLFKCAQLCQEVEANKTIPSPRKSSFVAPYPTSKALKASMQNPPLPGQTTPSSLTSKFAVSKIATKKKSTGKERSRMSSFHKMSLCTCPAFVQVCLRGLIRFVMIRQAGGSRVGTTSTETAKITAMPINNNINPIARISHQESERLSSLIQVLLDNIRHYDHVAISLLTAWALCTSVSIIALWKFVKCFLAVNERGGHESLWRWSESIFILVYLVGAIVELILLVVGMLWLRVYRRRLLFS